jgi:hypothetical protein
MISLVKSPPNHYDVLGLTPAAGDGEVVFAFARKMSMFGAHRPAEAAQICAAYEVLRNADKRREYDRSLGLGEKVPAPRQWAFAMSQHQWPGPAGAITASAAYAPAPPVVAEPEPQSRVTPQVDRASTIAERLRRLAEPMEFDGMANPGPEPAAPPRAAPQPEQPRAVEPAATAPETDIYRILARGQEAGRSRENYRRRIDWRRPALVVGGFAATAGLVGVLAGFSVKDDAASAVTPPPSAARQIAEAAPAPPAAASPVVTEAATPVAAAAPQTRHASSSSRFARAVERKLIGIDTTAQAQPVDVAAADPAAQPAPMVPASMPLPDNVVARTIDKIGYSCGSVASTAAVAGASGVFKVTCSSGQTYQATPVHGHYRFKRSRGQ